MSGINYTPMSLDDLEAQEKQIGFGNGGGQFYSFKEGRNVVRFLPGVNNQKAFVPFFKHFVKGGPDGKSFSPACPNRMAKLPCLICQAAARLSRGTDADIEMAKELTPRSRVICNLIDRSAPDAGPQMAEIGPQIYNAVKDYLRTMGEDPTDPTNGFDMIVEKSGSGLKTEYKVTAVRKNSPLHVDKRQLEDWLMEAHDLTKFVQLPSETDMAAKLAGTTISHVLSAPKRSALPAGKRPDRASPKGAMVEGDDDETDY